MNSAAVKVLLVVTATIGIATLTHGKANPAQVVGYLEQFGYLEPVDPTTGHLRSNDELILAVKKLQRMGGLPETGKLDDPELLKLLEKPRCGMPDFGPSDHAKRKRRYTLQGSYWHKKTLTYKILNYSPDLTKEKIDTSIAAAFNEWAKVTPLKFTRVFGEAKADINVKFVTGYHDDGYPFDGQGGTLAHAFYPQDNSQEIYGDAHFDDDELFTLNTNAGTDLFWVAVHEFGHSLGLDHSYEFNAIMYPYYKGYTPNFELNQDDIRGIQAIYGKPGEVQPTTAPGPATVTPHTNTEAPSVPNKCNTPVDAFVMSEYSYAFKGDYFWPIGDFGAWTTALKITEYWPLLEGNIDAAFTRRSDDVTFIFKEDKYWMYKDRAPLSGSWPRKITEEPLKLNASFANIDAAFQWARNDKVYFFKGTQYWRYDLTRMAIEIGYPRAIKDGWRGAIPDNIDAAVQWKNKKSYFFKGTTYTAINDYDLTIPNGGPAYPRSIGKYWMACSDEGQYVGVKILPDTSSVAAVIPNIIILVSSLVITLGF